MKISIMEVRKRKKQSKAEVDKEWALFMDKLRNTPPEKLSPVAKYWLAHEHDESVKLNMRYVMR